MTLGALSWEFVEAGSALAVPLPAGYVQCGTENGANNCPSGRIAYGALNEYVLRDVTAPFACNNSTFGDPVYGVVKGCYAGPSTPAALAVTPASLTFTGTVGGANPAAQTVALNNTGGGTLSWSVSDNAAWLTVSPLSGTTTTETDTLTAAINIAGLAAGTYYGVITVTGSGGSRTVAASLTLSAAGSTSAVPLPAGYVQCGTENGANNCPSGRIAYGAQSRFFLRDLTAPFACNNSTFGDPIVGVVKGCYAGPSTPAALAVTPASLAFTGTVGGANPAARTVALTNVGGGTLSWSVSDNAAWLTVSPVSGTTTTETDTLTAAINITGLAAGTYNGVITVTGSGGSRTIAASLTLSAAASTSPVSLPAGYIQCATENGANNCPSGRIAYGAQSRFFLRDLTAPFACNNSTFGDPIVGVAKACYAAGSTPVTITANPANLAFTGTVGGANPTARTVALTNAGGGTLSWTVSDNAAWLTVSPASGTTTTETDTLTAAINITGLAAGTYNGVITVTLSAPGSTPRQIPVSLTLSSGGTGTATLTWAAGTETDLAGYKVYRGTASGTYGEPVATVDRAVTSYVSSGLQAGTTYFFVITSFDHAGNESTFSNEVSKSIY